MLGICSEPAVVGDGGLASRTTAIHAVLLCWRATWFRSPTGGEHRATRPGSVDRRCRAPESRRQQARKKSRRERTPVSGRSNGMRRHCLLLSGGCGYGVGPTVPGCDGGGDGGPALLSVLHRVAVRSPSAGRTGPTSLRQRDRRHLPPGTNAPRASAARSTRRWVAIPVAKDERDQAPVGAAPLGPPSWTTTTAGGPSPTERLIRREPSQRVGRHTQGSPTAPDLSSMAGQHHLRTDNCRAR